MSNKNKRKGDKAQGQRRTRSRGSQGAKTEYRGKGEVDERSAIRSREGDNDVSWYSRYPALLEATARVPFPNMPGMKFDPIETHEPGGITSHPMRTWIPGVLAIDWFPTPGNSSGASYEAPSQVARELYARVRQVYSGELEADGPDMFMYVMCLDSVFSYIGWLKRIYRCLTAWTPLNYTIPHGVLAACGLSQACINDCIKNRMDLFGYINDLIYQSRTFLIPNVFDIMRRHYWMNDNVYLDGDSLNSQIYVYNQAGWYQYAELDPGPASGCLMVPSPATTATTALNLYNYGVRLLNALYNWSTARTINGYFRRAFEGEQVFVVDELRSDERLEPLYSEEVLMQIENTHVPTLPYVLGYPTDVTALNITQNPKTNAVLCPNELIWAGKTVDIQKCGFGFITPLNIRNQIPSVAEIVVASRMAARFEGDVGSSGLHIWGDTGTEWPFSIRMLDAFAASTSTAAWAGTQLPGLRNYVDGITPDVNLIAWDTLEAWDWHPFIPSVHKDSSNNYWFVPGGDIKNYTLVRMKELSDIHRVCILSEFNAYSII